MFTALIIQDEPAASSLVPQALVAAGCTDIAVAPRGGADTLISGAVAAPDLIVVTAFDARLLNCLVRLDVPIVVVCGAHQIDAAFLAGATECVIAPARARELEGRIRRALRAFSEAKYRRARENEMTNTLAALKRDKERLEQMICYDDLTGVATRRHALATLEIECRRSARDRNPLGLVMIDLDHFHAYNETYGHLGGDVCLQRVADAMNKCLRRPSDMLGRYGGEEFIAILPNTDIGGTHYVAETMRAAVEGLGIMHSNSTCAPVVTITAGFALSHQARVLTPEELFHAADSALMRAKQRGRNTIEGANGNERLTSEITFARAPTERVATAAGA